MNKEARDCENCLFISSEVVEGKNGLVVKPCCDLDHRLYANRPCYDETPLANISKSPHIPQVE